MKRLRVINKQLSVFFACLFVVMIGVYALISPGDGGDGHRMIDGFSVPFVAAALLGMITLVAAVRWLPELMAVPAPHAAGDTVNRDWRALARSLGPLLGMAFVAPLGLALFEATFALYGQAKFGYGPARVAALFVVCGLVMTVFQIGAVGLLAGRIRETVQIGAGFGLLGTGLALRAIVRSTFLVLALVGLLALGTALISPNLAALISH